MQRGVQHAMVSERGMVRGVCSAGCMVRGVQRGVHGEGGAAWGAAAWMPTLLRCIR